jgi:hypothetical protein
MLTGSQEITGMIRKIVGIKFVEQPKSQCEDFDSDCLTMEIEHLRCWVYQRDKGYCPFCVGNVKFNPPKPKLLEER